MLSNHYTNIEIKINTNKAYAGECWGYNSDCKHAIFTIERARRQNTIIIKATARDLRWLSWRFPLTYSASVNHPFRSPSLSLPLPGTRTDTKTDNLNVKAVKNESSSSRLHRQETETQKRKLWEMTFVTLSAETLTSLSRRTGNRSPLARQASQPIITQHHRADSFSLGEISEVYNNKT